ncbi:peptide methionine sulfoxide reductase-like protein [Leptotrombidium deliense]|uniref:Peptide methionine sulfoxide reductase-like protein n=1 Tax=Leptotrombidium deliense TaxID=299467 RepID=A0A443RTS1_9ACAR|nr:peptide methionine sulfoxide reductase-like protein [Leptotrombidium deliense]
MVKQQKYRRAIVTVITPVGTFNDAEDYHQKCKCLNLDINDLIKSHIAAKVKAYVYCYVSVNSVEKEANDLGLSDDQKIEIIIIVKAGVTSHC